MTPLIHTAPNWPALTAELHQERVRAAIGEAVRAQRALSANAETPTFDNTIVALERIQNRLREPLEVFKMAAVFDSRDDLVAAEEALAEPLSHFSQGLFQDAGIWRRVQALMASTSQGDLAADEAWLLTQTEQAFQRAGAHLGQEARADLQRWHGELAQKELIFSKTLMAATAAPFWVDRVTDLAGLPATIVGEAAERAAKMGRPDEWAFHLSMPNVRSALETSTAPAFRQGLWQAAQDRCRGGEHDTQELIRDILRLRSCVARTLGYPHWAAYVLSDTMAGNPEQADALLMKVWTQVLPKFEAETLRVQRALEEQTPGQTLRPADWFTGAEQVRMADYDFDAQALMAYLPRDRVRQGLFDFTQNLFGLHYEAQPQAPVFADRVDTYVVKRGEQDIGLLYIDDFQRPTKRAGAWMEQAQHSSSFDGEVRPIVGNALNLAGSDNNPLMTMDEVLTAFHELGHGLHGLLSKARFTSQSGTQVPRDFVELPSQLLENWANEPSVIQAFARHHETGAELPDDLLARWQEANRFNEGFNQAEYLLAAFLDLRVHQLSPEAIETLDLDAFTQQVKTDLGAPALLEPRYTLQTFEHVMGNEYSARYYAYLWSAVLDADVFSAFKEKGLFDPDLARSLEANIYAPGHSRPVGDSFRAFMGRDPDVNALMRRQGLISSAAEGKADIPREPTGEGRRPRPH